MLCRLLESDQRSADVTPFHLKAKMLGKKLQINAPTRPESHPVRV